MLTSGKVPLEKTLKKSTESASIISDQRHLDLLKVSEEVDLHQKTGLSTGTVADDDKFAANFSHLDTRGVKGQQMQVWRRNRRLSEQEPTVIGLWQCVLCTTVECKGLEGEAR